ncbi:hypothetical protein BgiMline_022528 [Biomphalaria glabrata]|nr:hypothetical protein BgiMline_010361 [Biomphalaria glabrata]
MIYITLPITYGPVPRYLSSDQRLLPSLNCPVPGSSYPLPNIYYPLPTAMKIHLPPFATDVLLFESSLIDLQEDQLRVLPASTMRVQRPTDQQRKIRNENRHLSTPSINDEMNPSKSLLTHYPS